MKKKTILNVQSANQIDPAEIQMIEERWEKYQTNPENTKTWEQVKASIIKKYDI